MLAPGSRLCLQSLLAPRAGKDESREAHEALGCHQTRDIHNGGGDSLFLSAPELSWIQSSLRLRKSTPLQGTGCDNEQQSWLPRPTVPSAPWHNPRPFPGRAGAGGLCRNVCRAFRSASLSVRSIPGSARSSSAQGLLCRNQREVGVGEIPAPRASRPHNGSSTSELPGNIILSFLRF